MLTEPYKKIYPQLKHDNHMKQIKDEYHDAGMEFPEKSILQAIKDGAKPALWAAGCTIGDCQAFIDEKE